MYSDVTVLLPLLPPPHTCTPLPLGKNGIINTPVLGRGQISGHLLH